MATPALDVDHEPVGDRPAGLLARTAADLYRAHFAFVWRNARRLGCSEDWVDDAVHEIFVVATRRWHEFEGRSSERTWLFAITFRVVQRMQRDRARQRRHAAHFAQQLPTATNDASRERETSEYVHYLLGLLSGAQRLVLILAELEGFTNPEIAQTLGIPLGTVHSRLRAAKQHLCRVIEEHEQSERSKP